MKRSTYLFCVVSAFALIALSHPLRAFGAEEQKIAFVDVAKIFDTYEKTKDSDRSLQDAGKKKEEERDAMVYDIRQLKDELLLMTGDMKTKKQELLEEKIKGLQDFDKDTKRQLSEQRSQVVQEIFKDIDAAIKRYGERKGLDFVFNERALLYHSDKYDATSEILEDLNKGAKKKK